MNVWVTLTVTDRALAARALFDDIVRQCAEVDVTPTVAIVENSASPVERAATADTARALAAHGCQVEILDDGPPSQPIAWTRERQRQWVQAHRRQAPSPLFVWMIDEDNRLDHLVFDDDGGVRAIALEHHLHRLVVMARSAPPPVLIGEVSGDPPIPPFATWASRLTDLVANLGLLHEAHPDDRASPVLAALPVSDDFDAYYDLSHERAEPSWMKPRRWLAGPMASCREVLKALYEEAAHLPAGVAFTRPILTNPERLGSSWRGHRRGGNAVFFDVDACIAHRYPSVELAGVTTRRSDMAGTLLLSRSHEVTMSGFSVRHCRPRDLQRPSPSSVARGVLADTFGAALVRGLLADDPGVAISAFLRDRIDVIAVVLDHLHRIVPVARDELRRGPPGDHPIHASMNWLADTVHTLCRSEALAESLSNPTHHADLRATCIRYQRSRDHR